MVDKKSSQSASANNSTQNAIIIGLALVLVVFIILFVTEKSKHGGQVAAQGSEVVSPLPDDRVILKYNGGVITAKDVKGNVEPRIKQLSEEVTDMYKKGAESALVERLLTEEMKKQNKPSISALLETVGTSANVSEAEITQFMKENNLEKGFKDPSTGKMRKVSRDEIKAHLANRSKTTERQGYVEKLMADANVEWVLKEPKAVLPAFTADEPVRGNRNAKVVIYEHSDFQCPYCARGKTVVDEIYKAYGDKVAIVFRHLPLEFHPQARPAALASICAGQQGKFWEYHDKLFDNQKALATENYPKWAKELGLDEGKFTSCLTSEEAKQTLAKSMAMSEQVGANSTPTFFVGSSTEGKKVAGAQPFPEFKKLIDAGLR